MVIIVIRKMKKYSFLQPKLLVLLLFSSLLEFQEKKRLKATEILFDCMTFHARQRMNISLDHI